MQFVDTMLVLILLIKEKQKKSYWHADYWSEQKKNLQILWSFVDQLVEPQL